ncbi:MAG: hypothetical protein ACYDBB_06650 [Armatimonadota bacterium]
MRYSITLSWAMGALMALGLMAPAQAKPHDNNEDRGNGRSNVRVVVVNKDDDDRRAFESWYNDQVRDYNDIDPITGERIGALLQLVTDVSRNRLTVLDRSNVRHTVLLNNRTSVTYEPRRGHEAFSSREYDNNRRGPIAATMIRPGHLILVQGFMHYSATMVATQVRIMGRTNGWSAYDDDDTPSWSGYRGYGEVRDVDTRRNRVTITITINTGVRTIHLRDNGEFLVDGQRKPLSYLRRGDRIMFYCKDRNNDDLFEADLIVILRDKDTYPDGDRPHKCDPDWYHGGKPTGGSHYDDRNVIEGRITDINTRLLFNEINLRGTDGRTKSVYAFKTLEVIDRDGRRTSVLKLREGDWLRVYYKESNGNRIAQRIEVR